MTCCMQEENAKVGLSRTKRLRCRPYRWWSLPGRVNPQPGQPPGGACGLQETMVAGSAVAGDYDLHLNHSYQALFVTDQRNVAPRLTVNYRLLWDYEGGLETWTWA
jgi:hypothetical protein